MTLDEAIKNNDLETVKTLVQNGAEVNIGESVIEKYGNTTWVIQQSLPLIIAIENEYLDIINYLLSVGANYNKYYKILEQTELIVACKNNNLQSVKELLIKGKYCTLYKKFALKEACKNGHLEIVKYLIEKGSFKDDYTLKFALTDATENKHWEIVKYFAEKHIIRKNDILHDALTDALYIASSGNLEMVKYLVEHGADADGIVAQYYTPLMAASADGYLDIVKYLVEHGAKINRITETPGSVFYCALSMASYAGQLEIVKYLMENGVNDKLSIYLALNDASDGGKLDVVKYLIEKGANNVGEALSLAKKKGHTEIAEFLEKHLK